jgi:hypothetical protein
MPMPEASVDEDYLTATLERKVWRPRQIPLMQPVSKAKSVNYSPHEHFRLCVAIAHEGHPLATLLLCQ